MSADLKRYRDALRIPLSRGNIVYYHIDGDDTFRSMRVAIEEASSPDASAFFVHLLGWHLDIDTPMPGSSGSQTFGEILQAADARGVQIRAMLWSNLLASNGNAIRFIKDLRNGAAILDASAPPDPTLELISVVCSTGRRDTYG